PPRRAAPPGGGAPAGEWDGHEGQGTDVSDTVQQAPEFTGGPPEQPRGGGRVWGGVRRGALLFAEQREATVLVVVLLLVLYFWRTAPDFLTKDNVANITWTVAPLAVIAIGEVLLLGCGELDLSVGCVLGLSGCLMLYLMEFWR